ncbi:hypothetical protein GLOIN_2v1778951 [Rhizophagus irregularis DAOM 181602=DAOM 197198]|nr:hypothetical protein GLOIN_2v1778951 [Rhizophagus irregularis DAOM 181602=DAOM 197198]
MRKIMYLICIWIKDTEDCHQALKTNESSWAYPQSTKTKIKYEDINEFAENSAEEFMKLINESAVEEIITEDGVQNSVSSSEIISNKITEELVVVHAALFCQKNDGSLQLSLKFWHSFRELFFYEYKAFSEQMRQKYNDDIDKSVIQHLINSLQYRNHEGYLDSTPIQEKNTLKKNDRLY